MTSLIGSICNEVVPNGEKRGHLENMPPLPAANQAAIYDDCCIL
jgi:hypothetical protein